MQPEVSRIIKELRASDEAMAECAIKIAAAKVQMESGIGFIDATLDAAKANDRDASDIASEVRYCAAAMGYDTIGEDFWNWLGIHSHWKGL